MTERRLPKLDSCPVCAKIAELSQLVPLELGVTRHLALKAQINRVEASHPRCRYCQILVGKDHLEKKLEETELGPMCGHCKTKLKRGVKLFTRQTMLQG